MKKYRTPILMPRLCSKRTIKLGSLLGLSVLMLACDASKGVSTSETNKQDPDPVVVDYPIAYIERPIPRDEDGNLVADNALDPIAFKPGAKLLIKDRAAVSASTENITDSAFIDLDAEDLSIPPLYDVKDLSVSYDGLKLLFAMRAPEIEDADDEDQPKWNIWEYNLETQELRRIISSDIQAELGHDVTPRYLPDERIVFASTRQSRSKAILLDENKPQFDPGIEDDRDIATFVLHTMNDDGSDIQQITYNQSHDIAPVVLEDGDIAFVRWNNYIGGTDSVSLFRSKIDGRIVSPYYGYHSQNTGTDGSEAIFNKPVLLPNGHLLATHRLRESNSLGGDIVEIDAENFVETYQTVADGVLPGPGHESRSPGLIYTNDTISPQGYFSSAYPMFDGSGRIIASWSSCLVEGISLGIYLSLDGELMDNLGRFVDRDGNTIGEGGTPVIPNADEVAYYPCGNNILVLDQLSTPPPLYGIWTFDPSDNTQKAVVLATQETMFTEAVVMEARALPTSDSEESTIDDTQQALIEANLGVVHIRSVYDFHGTDNTADGIEAMADPLQVSAAQRPARFIRLIKAVSLPNEDVYDFDNDAFGVSGGQMKDILGYVPIEPDGSAKFKVPSDVAFTFSILDANGRRLSGYLGDRHQNWLTVRPGETRECGGCHEADNPFPHGRLVDEAPSSWAGAIGGVSFPNTVLLDEFDTPHAPETGETMAEFYARINAPRDPSVNIVFEDEWTDASITAKAASFTYSYADLPHTDESALPSPASAPTSAGCLLQWSALCRVVINYIDHIQPVWNVERPVYNEFDPTLLITDNRCTTCHNTLDVNGATQLPAAQLDLTDTQSADRNFYLTSYVELFFRDVPQVITDGVLADETEQARDDDGNLLFLLDDMGVQILDGDGNPIPIMVAVDSDPAVLSRNGARANDDFFELFAPGGSHQDYLNAAELKLLSEWLDIGAQYYNNPFDAPED